MLLIWSNFLELLWLNQDRQRPENISAGALRWCDHSDLGGFGLYTVLLLGKFLQNLRRETTTCGTVAIAVREIKLQMH